MPVARLSQLAVGVRGGRVRVWLDRHCGAHFVRERLRSPHPQMHSRVTPCATVLQLRPEKRLTNVDSARMGVRVERLQMDHFSGSFAILAGLA